MLNSYEYIFIRSVIGQRGTKNAAFRSHMYDILWFPSCKVKTCILERIFYFMLLTTDFKSVLNIWKMQSALHCLTSAKDSVEVSSSFLWNLILNLGINLLGIAIFKN